MSLVEVVRVTPVALLMIVTVALLITAWDLSMTVPSSVALAVAWANEICRPNEQIDSNNATKRMPFRIMSSDFEVYDLQRWKPATGVGLKILPGIEDQDRVST